MGLGNEWPKSEFWLLCENGDFEIEIRAIKNVTGVTDRQLGKIIMHENIYKYMHGEVCACSAKSKALYTCYGVYAY